MQTIKNLVRFPMDIRRALRLLQNGRRTENSLTERPIVLDLSTADLLIDSGRHLAAIAHHSREIGSPLLLRCSRQLLALIARKTYGRVALANPATDWLSPDSVVPSEGLCLSDSRHSTSPDAIEMLIGRDVIAGSMAMPYPMHPNVLPHAKDQLLSQLRFTLSRRGIFFAGNQKAKYDNDQIKSTFDVMSRPQVLRTIHDHFGDRIAQPLLASKWAVPIVIHDSRVDQITTADWLPTLAQFSFFVCAPGSSQPLCHNVIEAMSVGTIPIIEYGDRLTPALEDGVNSICFQGATGLREAVARIDSLQPSQMAALRGNVVNYYENHLRSDRFFIGLRDNRDRLGIQQISLPFHHKNLFERAAKAA